VTVQSNSLGPTYEQTQQALFVQILRAVRIGVLAVLAISLLSLVSPPLRTVPIMALTGIVLAELGVTELSYWLLRRGRARQGAICYVLLTLINATLVGAVLQLPAFVAAITALMVAMGALLIGPRYAVAPGILGIGCYGLLTIAGKLGWFWQLGVPQGTWLITLVQIGFVVVALSVVVAVSVLTSARLQQVATEAQMRAAEAERARAEQTHLAEQLAAQVEEQRRLLETIRELEVPVVPVLEGVLVLPLVGHLDSQRLQVIERQVLEQIASERATLLLVDVTGIPIFDTAVARGILRLGQALRLLGTRMALTGLKPATAHTLVQLEVNLGSIDTYARIQDALAEYQQATVRW
jgi:rsbT co-antagonist protein RsbR